jgi:hypothetical protein
MIQRVRCAKGLDEARHTMEAIGGYGFDRVILNEGIAACDLSKPLPEEP